MNKDVSVETEEDVIRSLAVVFAIQGGMGTDVNIVALLTDMAHTILNTAPV